MGILTSRPSSMFGGKISDHLDKDGVNKFVKWSVEEIERTGEGLRTDALYRASGGHEDVQRIRGQAERGMQEVLNQETNVHVLTGALKLYFRSLKQPILRIEEFQDVLEGRENGNDASDKLVEVIQNLPKLHRPTLAFFFKHLYRVMHELKNKMSLASLGVVFGPTLMRVSSHMRTDDVVSMQISIEELNLVVELLLQHYRKVFNDNSSESESAYSLEFTPCVQSLDTAVGGSGAADNQLRVTTEDRSSGDINAQDDTKSLPSSKDTTVTTDELPNSYNESEKPRSEADHVACSQPPGFTSDKRSDNLDVFSSNSDDGSVLESKKHSSARTRNVDSTSSTFSYDQEMDSTNFTSGRKSKVTTDGSSAELDKSSDSEDIDSVLAHIAKALTPDHDSHMTDDVIDEDRSSPTSSLESTGIQSLEDPNHQEVFTAEGNTSSEMGLDTESVDSITETIPVYSSPVQSVSTTELDTSDKTLMDIKTRRISYGDGSKDSAGVSIPDTSKATVETTSTVDSVTTSDATHDDPDVCSVEEKIRLFSRNGEDVSSSLKKQKTIANQESEEDKNVKTELEQTFEKVTQQRKSNVVFDY